MKRSLVTLLILLCAASTLRLAWLSWGGAFMDEVSFAFRAVGMVDTLLNPIQTTPIEWYDPDPPTWTSWSFHDHPPLVMAVQHFFMQLLGDTRFAFRLPSALLGIASVLLIYGIGRELYSERVGLLAAGLFAVCVNSVYISRVGLQEGYVIFFMLLFLLCLLRSPGRPNYLLGAGAALGLGLLSKYHMVLVLPVACVFLFSAHREHFATVQLWLGLLLALGRLHSDQEIYGMRACGVGTAALVAPVLAVGRCCRC